MADLVLMPVIIHWYFVAYKFLKLFYCFIEDVITHDNRVFLGNQINSIQSVATIFLS